MPHDNELDLALYRIRRAEETLVTAERELAADDYRTANNRAYYAVFHAIRALLALDGADYKKHSGVLAHFNRYYIKTGVFPASFSEIVGNASEIRNGSDYDDFYLCSRTETAELIDSVRLIVAAIEKYLNEKQSNRIE